MRKQILAASKFPNPTTPSSWFRTRNHSRVSCLNSTDIFPDLDFCRFHGRSNDSRREVGTISSQCSDNSFGILKNVAQDQTRNVMLSPNSKLLGNISSDNGKIGIVVLQRAQMVLNGLRATRGLPHRQSKNEDAGYVWICIRSLKSICKLLKTSEPQSQDSLKDSSRISTDEKAESAEPAPLVVLIPICQASTGRASGSYPADWIALKNPSVTFFNCRAVGTVLRFFSSLTRKCMQSPYNKKNKKQGVLHHSARPLGFYSGWKQRKRHERWVVHRTKQCDHVSG